MEKVDSPDDVTVVSFDKDFTPSRFYQASEGSGLSPAKDNDIVIQYNIDGQCFYIRKKNGLVVDIVESVEDTPVIQVIIDEEHWRDVVAFKYEAVFDLFTDPLVKINSKGLMSAKGTLKVNLKKRSGDILPITLIYNGADEPSASLSLDLEDWASMHKKETTGQALFVSGRLTFTGDMHFLMRLQTLI